MRIRRIPTRFVAIAAGAVLVLGTVSAIPAAAAPAAGSSGYTVIASGLNNPRHISAGSQGVLYVAESGVGGNGPCITSSEGSFVCYGPTGSITQILHTWQGWAQRRVVTGLPSMAPPKNLPPTAGSGPVIKGSSATGPSGVQVTGNYFVASIGLGAPPALRGKNQATNQAKTAKATLPAGFGNLLAGTLNGNPWCRLVRFPIPKSINCSTSSWRSIADISQFEQRHNPVDDLDSNPASVVRFGADNYLVADAGGNTVLNVSFRGQVSLVAAFKDKLVSTAGLPIPGLPPMLPMQTVPTAVVTGPGASFYVSQLTGFPFPVGGATIFKVTPGHNGKAAVVRPYAKGLTNVTDLAFGPHGDLYAVEIASTGLLNPQATGSVVRIPRGGGAPQVVVSGLNTPYGIAISGNDAYVTTGSVLPGGGQVIRIPLGH